MNRVLLYDYNGDDFGVLFELKNTDDLEKAIKYRDDNRDNENYEGWSDYEIILDYLDINNIEYSCDNLNEIRRLYY